MADQLKDSLKKLATLMLVAKWYSMPKETCVALIEMAKRNDYSSFVAALKRDDPLMPDIAHKDLWEMLRAELKMVGDLREPVKPPPPQEEGGFVKTAEDFLGILKGLVGHTVTYTQYLYPRGHVSNDAVNHTAIIGKLDFHGEGGNQHFCIASLPNKGTAGCVKFSPMTEALFAQLEVNVCFYGEISIEVYPRPVTTTVKR